MFVITVIEGGGIFGIFRMRGDAMEYIDAKFPGYQPSYNQLNHWVSDKINDDCEVGPYHSEVSLLINGSLGRPEVSLVPHLRLTEIPGAELAEDVAVVSAASAFVAPTRSKG